MKVGSDGDKQRLAQQHIQTGALSSGQIYLTLLNTCTPWIMVALNPLQWRSQNIGMRTSQVHVKSTCISLESAMNERKIFWLFFLSRCIAYRRLLKMIKLSFFLFCFFAQIVSF